MDDLIAYVTCQCGRGRPHHTPNPASRHYPTWCGRASL